LIIGFQVTVENVVDVFFETQCIKASLSATAKYKSSWFHSNWRNPADIKITD